ncbi:MAG: T9SS type A sorting domain-containing protein [Bacteroidia bacterium]|nr:T9SS type A sorting domain-containing protein [Bacteroidia bacterium]
MKRPVYKLFFLLLFNVFIADFTYAINLKSGIVLGDFISPPDTIKPTVDLLGIDTIITKCKEEHIDAPIALVDDVNTDAEMRANLIVVPNLPKNSMGNIFCDEPGFFKTIYQVSDLSGNLSDTAIRTIHCKCSEMGISPAQSNQEISLRVDPLNGLILINLVQPTNQHLEVKIYDFFGKEMQSNQFQENSLNELEIQTNVNFHGIYLVKVDIGGHAQIKKIVLH